MQNSKNRDEIKNLFENSLYLEVIELSVKRSERIGEMKKVDYKLSPQSKLILSLFSPESQSKLARSFYLDDIELNKKLIKDEIIDPDYVYIDNSGVGLYLELWICSKLTCIGCGEKLYKYANPNMPIVDVKCINPNHTFDHGSKYYQIKATQSNVKYAGTKYFSYDEEYIKVGSVKYGYNCHMINATDPIINRDILINYICIEYDYIDPNNIIINMKNSFIVMPKLNLPNTIPMTFYTYTNTDKIPTIKFNNIMTNKYRFSDIYKPFGVIKLNLYFDVVKVYNNEVAPLLKLDMDTSDDFQIKYLKMKIKYINLKKTILL